MGNRKRLAFIVITIIALVSLFLLINKKQGLLEEGKDYSFYLDDSSGLYVRCWYQQPPTIFSFDSKTKIQSQSYVQSFARLLNAGRDSLIKMGSDSSLYSIGNIISIEDGNDLISDTVCNNAKQMVEIVELQLKRKVVEVVFTRGNITLQLHQNK